MKKGKHVCIYTGEGGTSHRHISPGSTLMLMQAGADKSQWMSDIKLREAHRHGNHTNATSVPCSANDQKSCHVVTKVLVLRSPKSAPLLRTRQTCLRQSEAQSSNLPVEG